MTRKFSQFAFAQPNLAKFALPGVAAAVFAGAALAAQGDERAPDAAAEAAYDQAIEKLEAGDAASHAAGLFAQADLNRDAVLDAVEYEALAIVTAELARLNGFVPILIADGVSTASLAEAPGKALTNAERARVEAIAARDFYLAAGADDQIVEAEFVAETMERFESADRNRNGVLGEREISVFAAASARLSKSSV